jgi:hypothetical protein
MDPEAYARIPYRVGGGGGCGMWMGIISVIVVHYV